MRSSISVATSPCNMPQIMFSEHWEHHIHEVARMGYEGIDLFIPTPLQADITYIAKTIKDAGLAVAMVAAQGNIMAEGYFFNDPQPQRLEHLLELSKLHLDMAAQLQTLPNIGFIRGNLPHSPQEQSESLHRMAEGMARYCELAASFGLNVLLEPICRYEINSCNTVAQSLELMDMAGNPQNLSLLLDVFHMNIEEASLLQSIEAAQGRIGHVHFVDNTRAVPGYGCLPLAEIYKTLQKTGYQGFLGVEAIPGSNPIQEAHAALHYIHALQA